MEKKASYKAIGVMSGTSLDGMDVCACTFFYENESWSFEINFAEVYSYPKYLLDKLKNAPVLSGLDLAKLHVEYGAFTATTINEFIESTGFDADFVASHGYTVFHDPHHRLTTQIGSGAEIAAKTKLKTIVDFRTGDVALGGQGAPLVPIGDELLFSTYAACLNLGGFSNLSFSLCGSRMAYDICPTNMLLNHLAQKLGKPYDESGQLGAKGNVIPEVLNKLNEIGYYQETFPKSLGREFFEEQILPLLRNDYRNEDLLRTAYEHIAIQLADNINCHCRGEVLVTGGGAHNIFLIELLKAKTKAKIFVPPSSIVDYKEALIFAFLGVLRIREQTNCLRTVTGAERDNIGGAIYL